MKKTNFRAYLPAIITGFILLLIVSSCQNYEDVSNCVEGKTYGFLNGLWHGIIAPIDLIGMLFKDDVTVYAPNNNGFGYALGFVIGSGGWGFFGGNQASRRSKRNCN